MLHCLKKSKKKYQAMTTGGGPQPGTLLKSWEINGHVRISFYTRDILSVEYNHFFLHLF